MKMRQAFILCVFCGTGALAQVIDPHNILIRNVQLLETAGDAESVAVSILIRDNLLEAISKDEIPAPEGVVAIDAEGGFLLGRLVLKETPSFLILDQDPRNNIDALLDTKTHAVFAVHGGELRKNTLFEVTEDFTVLSPDEAPAGWLAYTPPPMMLPLSYQGGDKWNQWQSKYINGIFLAAVVLDRQRWLTQDSDSVLQVGDLDDFDGGEIRGLRLGAVGTLNFDTPWVYTIFAATNAFDKGFDTEQTDDLTLFDYRLDIPLARDINLSVGKQKEPMSMERTMSMINLPMQERAAVSDALMPARNFGVVASGNGIDGRMTWAGGLFNNLIDSGESIGNTSTALVGRVTWLPFISQDESNLVHLGLGARFSNGKSGIQTGTEPEFNQSPFFVDTGDRFSVDSATTWNLEASWRKGPYWLHGEYVRASADAPVSGDPTFDGYHITASWILTGEMRGYNRKNGLLRLVPVAKSVYQGGWGAWEIGARYSTVDLTDGLIEGGEMDILSLGVNWWLTPIFHVSMNYRHVTLDRRGLNGTSDGINARVLLVLE